jgi:tetratricopeptide (TPR) repeat protein
MRAVLIALMLTFAFPAVAAVRRYPGDERQVDEMRKSYPEVLALLEKGEALAAAGSLDEARDLFEKADAEAPYFTLVRRRDCEVLTALGRRDDAIAACIHALEDSRSNIDERALVRAYVDGPKPPASEDLARALTLTSLEGHRSPGMPAPAAMACEVAESLGDGAMLQHCIEELSRIAPADPELPRALRAMAPQCPPWRFWGGWLAIVIAIGLTAVHALRRGVRRSSALRTAAAAGILLLAAPAVARADESPSEAPATGWLSRRTVDDDNPENSIPTNKERNDDPLDFGYWLQDVALKAERADKRGDHASALKFYSTLAKAVPDRAIGFSKMCGEYEALGDLEQATNSCGEALMRDGVRLGDYQRFVRLVLHKPGKLSETEVGALAQVVQHMKDDPEAKGVVDEVECEIGVRTSNMAQLRECTTALAARAPNDPKTVTYQWALAIQEGKFDDADRLVERASTLGVHVEAMRQTTADSEKRHRLILFVIFAGVLLAGAAAFAGRAAFRRRLTADPA